MWTFSYISYILFFQYNLIPKSVLSLKVVQELPIIVVLMYQLYKQNVHSEVSNFIPLIMETITLQPPSSQRYISDYFMKICIQNLFYILPFFLKAIFIF